MTWRYSGHCRPETLAATQAEWEARPSTFTIGKNQTGGVFELLSHTATNSGAEKLVRHRANMQLNLLADVQQHLPPFRATWTTHDGGRARWPVPMLLLTRYRATTLAQSRDKTGSQKRHRSE